MLSCSFISRCLPYYLFESVQIISRGRSNDISLIGQVEAMQ
jgi:hypothetical protein